MIHTLLKAGAILFVSVPATIITSACLCIKEDENNEKTNGMKQTIFGIVASFRLCLFSGTPEKPISCFCKNIDTMNNWQIFYLKKNLQNSFFPLQKIIKIQMFIQSNVKKITKAALYLRFCF